MMGPQTPPHLVRLGWPVSNVWLLRDPRHGAVMIDTGFMPLWPRVRAGLRRHGVAPTDLTGAVLTHRHADHAGNAHRLLELGVPVAAHRLDAEILAGRRPRPRLARPKDRASAIMCRVENARPAPHCEARALEDGDVVWGLEVCWVPGHTAGSVFFYHADSATLFTGDGLLNAVPPTTVRTALCLPAPEFSDDHGRALRSLADFFRRERDVRWLCAGHGPVRRGPVAPAVRALLADAV